MNEMETKLNEIISKKKETILSLQKQVYKLGDLLAKNCHDKIKKNETET